MKEAAAGGGKVWRNFIGEASTWKNPATDLHPTTTVKTYIEELIKTKRASIKRRRHADDDDVDFHRRNLKRQGIIADWNIIG